MEAWAAAAEQAAQHGAEAAHASPPFYADATFWVAIGFIVFIAAVARTAYKIVTTALDERADRIRTQIEEAEHLAADAEAAFADFQKRQSEADAEVEVIVANAEQEAKRFAERSAAELEQSLKRREQQAMDRIAQVEAAAVAEVRARAAEISIAATRRLLVEQLTAKRANALIDAAIEDLPKKMH